MSTDAIPISSLEQRQLTVITRRFDQVEPVIDAIHRPPHTYQQQTESTFNQRLHELSSRSQRGAWDISQPKQAIGSIRGGGSLT